MATTPNDLLSAIDSYMQTKGKGMSYLASRVSAIFDDKDAPLNAKTGPLSFINEMFDDLRIDIKALHTGATSPISVFKKEVNWLNRSLKSFTTKIKDTMVNFGLVDTYLKSITSISQPAKAAAIVPYKTTSQGFLKVSIWDLLPKYNLLGIPVYVKSISDNVVSQLSFKREKILPTRNNTPAVVPRIVGKVFTQQNNYANNNNDGNNKKGGWLSSLLGIGTILLGIGWLNTELNKTAAGKEVKTRIKTFISTLFDKVGAFLTSDKFKGYITSAITGIGSIFKWLGKDIFNKISKGNYSGAIVESLFSYLLIRKLPIVKWILRPIEMFLKSGFGKLFSNVGSSVWSGLSRFGGILTRFLGRASVIGGILTGLYVIWDRGTEIFKIVKDINETSKIALDSARNTKKGWDAKNKIRNDKISTELAELTSKEKNGTLSSIEQIRKSQLLLQQEINANDQILEKIVNDQAKRSSSVLGLLVGQETEYEKNTREKLNFINDRYKRQLKDLTDQAQAQIEAQKPQNMLKVLPNNSIPLNYWQEMEKNLNMLRKANGLKELKTLPVNDATVIQPHSKDQIIMAKNGGPFDLAMKQLNKVMQEKLDALIDAMTANIHATVEGSSAIVKTVAATSGKNVPSSGISSSHDPIRLMRNQVNSLIR